MLVEQQWNNKKAKSVQTRDIPQFMFCFFFWLPSYLQETEEPSSLWGTIKMSAHCCSAIINVALHCLPLVAYVRRMNTHCTQLQPFSSERGDNCHSHFCQIETNLPDVLRCPQQMDGFHVLQAIETPVCGFEFSYLGWTFCIYCATECCAWYITLLTGKYIQPLFCLYRSVF